MTRYLLAGATGMLGSDLQKALVGRDVVALSHGELDVSNSEAVDFALAGVDVVLNAAAYTKVDDAESHEDEAYAINALGARNLAAAAARSEALLVQFSTDYVFDGHSTTPYQEDAERRPASAYGRTKASGEEFALRENPDRTIILRTAWLYGEYGSNFVSTMLRLSAQQETVTVVSDQIGQPTWTKDLAERTVQLLDTGTESGIYHGTNSGQTSWFELARAVFEFHGLDPNRVMPTSSSEFVRPAQRPAYSVLGHKAWAGVGFPPMRDWKHALREAVASGAIDFRN